MMDAPPDPSVLPDSLHFRSSAVELRRLAESEEQPEEYTHLLDLAERCDQLADRLDRLRGAAAPR